jgi:hypothetical protein
VREVDELEDPVDERVAERDERVDRSRRKTDPEDAEEVVRILGEVDGQPDAQQDNEDDPDDREDAWPRPVEEGRDRRRPFSALLDCYCLILDRLGGG